MSHAELKPGSGFRMFCLGYSDFVVNGQLVCWLIPSLREGRPRRGAA